jgi:predicted ATPase with chaperone activity
MHSETPLSSEVWERTPPEAQAYMRALEAQVGALEATVICCPSAPGSGTSMLARRLATHLPARRRADALETIRRHRVASLQRGALRPSHDPPLRAPYHTTSAKCTISSWKFM